MATKFKTVEWATSANIYEVNLRQYTPEGTFAAFEKELPRLRNMGVDILWFMPLTPISVEKRQGSLGSYYACHDYSAVSEEFGSAEDFKTLVLSAHEQGFKVIIDWVANHTGWDHVLTKAHPDFYRKNNEGKFYEEHGWVDVIDLDYNNRQLHEEMVAAMNFWIEEFNIDGFRCDMAHLVPLDFWFYARTVLDAKKELFWLAETEAIDYHQVFDATYTWEFLHTMEAVAKNNATLPDLKNVLQKYDDAFPPDALRLFFTSNHDENSHSGSEYDRLGDSAKMFAVLCALWKNSLPLIYSGQEMPNKKQLKFFDKDVIEWTGEYLLNDFYKILLSVRKRFITSVKDNMSATKVIDTNVSEYIFAFLKEIEGYELLVILNFSASKTEFTISDQGRAGKFINVFSGVETDITAAHTFQIEKFGYLVYNKIMQNHE